MTAVRALILTELRMVSRDPVMGISLAVYLAMAVAAPPFLHTYVEGPAGKRGEKAGVHGAEQADLPLPTVAVVGEWPSGLSWPDGFVPEGEAEVVVRVLPGAPARLLLPPRSEGAPGMDAIEERLNQEIDAHADRMRASWGVDDRPRLSLEAAGPIVVDRGLSLKRMSPSGLFALSLAGLIAAGLAADLLPRMRSVGLLEQVRATQTTSAELIRAWFQVILGLVLVGTLGLAGGATLSERLWSGLWPAGSLAMVHALPFGALITAASLRASLSATDVVAANLRATASLLLAIAAAMVAGTWMAHPAVVALVPFGGVALAGAGALVGPWAWVADAVSLGWTALLLRSCGAALDAEESAASGVDHALLRRARGDYLPEALALGAMGLSAGVVNSVGGSAHLWLAWTLGFGGLMWLPAWLASPVLDVPRAELLPLGPVGARSLGPAVPIAVGMLALAGWIEHLSSWVLPRSAWLDTFSRGLSGLVSSPARAVAIGLYPAICEEALYRGAIYGLLRRRFSPPAAIALQAALFSVAHGASFRLLWTFVFGVIAGWMRHRSGSLWPGMALHFLFNTSAGVAMWMGWASLEPATLSDLLALSPLLIGLVALAWVRPEGERATT